MHPVLQAENKEQFDTELEVHLDQQRYLRSLLIQYHPIHQVSYNFQCLMSKWFFLSYFSGCFPPEACSVLVVAARERLRVSVKTPQDYSVLTSVLHTVSTHLPPLLSHKEDNKENRKREGGFRW